MQNPPVLRIGGQVTKSLYQFTLQSPDKEELYTTTERWKRSWPGFPRCVMSRLTCKSDRRK